MKEIRLLEGIPPTLPEKILSVVSTLVSSPIQNQLEIKRRKEGAVELQSGNLETVETECVFLPNSLEKYGVQGSMRDTASRARLRSEIRHLVTSRIPWNVEGVVSVQREK